MSDWTTDIDHLKYKETKRKFQAEEPLTAIEALVAFNEFRGGLGDDGYSEMEIERHLQEHVGRVAELEGVNEALSEELVAQAAEAGALSTAEGLVAGLQAQLESSRAEVERLRAMQATGLVRWGEVKPEGDRYFILYEPWDGAPMLFDNCVRHGPYVVANGLKVTGDASLDQDFSHPISDQSMWCYVPSAYDFSEDFTDGEPTWQRKEGGA